MPYAAKTEVPAKKTRAEIETLIGKNGGTHFAYMSTPEASIIGFMMGNTRLRFTLPLLSRGDRRFTHRKIAGSADRVNTQEQAYAAWEQASRSRWRALLLVLKAKLEAVEVGITSVEQEFLAHVVIEGGQRTVGEAILPRLKELALPLPTVEGETRRQPRLGDGGYLP